MAKTKKPAHTLFHPPLAPQSARNANRLCLVIVFTTIPNTIAALQASLRWSRELDVQILIVVPVVVPFPLELQRPRVDPEYRLRELRKACHREQAEIQVNVVLCRDCKTCLLEALPPCSLVLLGRGLTWWPWHREKRLQKILANAGHQAVLVSYSGASL